MPNLSLALGAAVSIAIMAWSLTQPGAGRNILDLHGIIVVLGGALAALLISTPAMQIFSALRAMGWAIGPGELPSSDDVALEVMRLAKRAQAEGGLLALRSEPAEFAGGFLKRAIEAAASCNDTDTAREILQLEVRRRRVARQEDANVFRTLGTLAPMFGLMGTLLGMLKVLTNMSEPSRLGPAMALALSSAFVGISVANFLCVPMAGQIRLLSLRETQVLEMMIEGILAIASNRPSYEIELRMGAYLSGARTTLRAPA